MEFTPSAGEELQSEYFVPRSSAEGALLAVRALAHRIWPLLYISEIRTIRGDDLWLSTAQGAEPRVAIHFTWRPDSAGVSSLLPDLEAALAPFGARCHWGKVFSCNMGKKVASLYPHWSKFQALRQRVDPDGIFLNAYLLDLGLGP